MGWLQDRINQAIQGYHSRSNPARYLAYCRKCLGAYWASQEIYGEPDYRQGFPNEGRCFRCREEERPVKDLLEWAKANHPAVEKLRARMEGRKGK